MILNRFHLDTLGARKGNVRCVVSRIIFNRLRMDEAKRKIGGACGEGNKGRKGPVLRCINFLELASFYRL